MTVKCFFLEPKGKTASNGNCKKDGRNNKIFVWMQQPKQWDQTLTIDSINPSIKANEYAIRGPLPIRASEIEKEIEKGVKKPFKNVIKANIGDPPRHG